MNTQTCTTAVRVASNRTFYRQAQDDVQPATAGHPTWYGARFALGDPTTWPVANTYALTQHVVGVASTIAWR